MLHIACCLEPDVSVDIGSCSEHSKELSFGYRSYVIWRASILIFLCCIWQDMISRAVKSKFRWPISHLLVHMIDKATTIPLNLTEIVTVLVTEVEEVGAGI